SILWDIHSPSHFFVATEAGTVRYFDIRNVTNGQGAAPVYTLVAHDEAVSAMDQHPTVRGLLVTGSADETVKVWDVREHRPSMVISRNLDVGSVFAARFCPDEPMLMAVGGSNGESRIWDMSTNADVRSTFGDATVRAVPVVEKPLVGLQKDEDADDDEDDNPDAVIAEMHGDVMQPLEAKPSDDDDDEEDDDDDDDDEEDAAMASDSE
ncbi:rRNA-processing protein, partial [Coemansia sp. S100]